MNDLHRALGDIHAIRRHMANTTEFGGYGPATLASTAALAVFAAVVQQVWLSDASLHLAAYFFLGMSTALLSVLLTGLACIAVGDARALVPWAMGIPFGIGQLLVAAILFFWYSGGTA